MRRPLAAVTLLAVAMLVSACAASQAPNWTFAPPTPVPTPGPSQSAGASGGTSAGASAAPSAAAPSAGASAVASAGASTGASAPAASGAAAGGSVVNLTASGIQWTTTDLKAPANAAFTIHFDNQDQGVPHNLNIKNSSGQDVFKSDILVGPAQADYQIPALAPGTYIFVCNVHPSMQGTLTVGP